jgi:leucyl-tRNA synthetase
MDQRYEPQGFEERWAADWESRALYAAPDRAGEAGGRPKRFVMEMFPYPSGDLHMGHVENYTIADAMARYWRMKGFEVMHPMGYDAFGLPAENAAIQRKVHPREWTHRNIEQMRSSFRRLGYSYDWDREVISCEPDYYRWNQWIFLKMYERGLAYRQTAPVYWCPVDKTVLANEQISTGVCWRCGTPPEVRDLTQWFLKITAYADRLLDEMEGLAWSDSVLNQQRHWIGRSRGAEVTFLLKVDVRETPIEAQVFTTRPDTLWGATFFVMAPEHPLAAEFVEGTEYEEAFRAFLEEVRLTREVDRVSSKGLRKGMALPAVAINPVNGREIPVWAADYVLMGYGTGAIMAVPAHDQRDFEFARQHGIPVEVVIQPESEELDGETMTEAYDGPGVMVNSGPFDGTVAVPETHQGRGGSGGVAAPRAEQPDSLEAAIPPRSIDLVTAWLAEQKRGSAAIQYRQRDWLVSRQRYWGTPIPIIHCPDCGEVPVPYEDLPVLLPEGADYTLSEPALSPSANPSAPLANVAEFVNVDCPRCGGAARRETDTLDTFFDSSWYFLRYCDPHNLEEPFAPEKVAGWCPIDQYVGGTEHAVMHLIYARFFTKVFQDLGLVDFAEPFSSLFNQGSITVAGEEMSKSRGNAIEAAEVVERFGADSARVFILFCSPPAAAYDFPRDGMEEIGRVAHSWLSKVWRVLQEVSGEAPPADLEKAVHRTIKAVTEDMDAYGYNTAIARMMELVNAFTRLPGPVPRASAEAFLKLLAPIAPFLTEELWHRYGNQGSIHLEEWPAYDEARAAAERVTMVVQVNGKVRDRLEVDAAIGEDAMKALALESEKVKAFLDGKQPQKIVAVPPRLVNVVI